MVEGTQLLQGPDHYTVDADGETIYLLGSRCTACGAAFYPEQAVCARCGHRDREQLRLGPTGTVYTWTRVHQSTPEFQTPYVLVYVDFPQLVRVLLPWAAEGDPRIGMPVRLVRRPGPRRNEEGMPVTLVHAEPIAQA